MDRERLLEQIFAAQVGVQKYVAFRADNPLLSVNLTMQQLKVLIMLAGSGGMATTDLTRRLGVSMAAGSGLIDRLVTHGYVIRQEDPKDRRIRRLHATPAGRAVVDEIVDTGMAQQRDLFARLDDDTLGMLATVLDRLCEAIVEEATERGPGAVRESGRCPD